MAALEEHLKAYYQSKSLSTQQIQTIQVTSPLKAPPKFWIRALLKYAAVICLTSGVAYSSYIWVYKPITLPYKFAREVAFNHNKHQPITVETNDIKVLRRALDKLNFVLDLPAEIYNTFVLKGGRYCSIDNRIAAQLKLQDQNGQIATCYIFKKEEHFKIEDNTIDRGVRVRLWDDGDRIFAIAVDN